MFSFQTEIPYLYVYLNNKEKHFASFIVDLYTRIWQSSCLMFYFRFVIGCNWEMDMFEFDLSRFFYK